ncbi:unnamed protein product [Adineta steineri]|uniref:NAD(P)(+)--arginine ADP-ribosyltransferase n=1 Tax=Adineta steineri TaxID=433720 RepID=A0A814D2Y4_9BILA|nr:unnamed protein product [Adineta steineri]CAF1620453.1 unnamed protein product [Adineta steineri]
MQSTALNCNDDDQIAFNIMKKTRAAKSSNIQEAAFMYSQLLRDIFCEMDTPLEIMIDFCREKYYHDKIYLKFINELKDLYFKQSPIHWYTQDGFLYKILNDSLRTLDIKNLIHLRRYIKDLHMELLSLHKMSSNVEWPKLFRGVHMPASQFNILMQNQGCLLSFNQFLSTTYNRDLAMFYAGSSNVEDNSIAVVFEIIVSHGSFKTTFANIENLSNFGSGEEEVLFSMGSVFRIETIEKLNNDVGTFIIRLHLTDDNDIYLTQVTEQFRLEMLNIPPYQKLIHLLYRMGEYQQAEQIALFYMKPLTEGPAASLFNCSMVSWMTGDRDNSNKMCIEGLELERRTLSSNDPKLIQTYRNLAYIYSMKGCMRKALEYYLEYVKIERDSPSLASGYGSIGRIYEMKEDFINACIYYKQALKLRSKCLPETHPEIAVSYLRLGVVSYKLDYYSDALIFLKKSLNIQQSSLPEYHHQIADTHHWIGSALGLQGNMHEAINHFEKAIAIGSKTLGIEHKQINGYIKARDCLRLLIS